MTITHLLYLHGFRSSPQSFKAQWMARKVKQDFPDVRFLCPQLPVSPELAMAQICGQVRNWPASQSAVMGSSLGGYYATWLAERFGWRAVVINPVVHAERDLASQVGQHLHWHDATQTLDFRPQDVQALRAWSVPGVTHPERYFTLIAKGDELLDWTEMQGHYRNAPGHLLEGGDHALSDFPSYADEILTFLQLKPRA